MVYCDLSKAFDRVWHKGLVHKLKIYRINGSILEWFDRYMYLSNITKCYRQKMGYIRYLHPSYVRAGLHKGSVLGPFFVFAVCK